MDQLSLKETTKSVSAGKLTHRQIVLTMIGVVLSLFLSSLDQTIVGIAMPRIVSDLGGFSQYTWVTIVYIIVVAITQPIIGKLTDQYGLKKFYVAGLIIFVAASLLCGFSQTMTQLIAFRGTQALGASIMMSNSYIIIGDIFPPAERGKYQSYLSGTWVVASIIGPTLGGFITDAISWHWIFFVNVPLGVLITALIIKYFPNIRFNYNKPTIDYLGFIAIIFTVVPAMMALQTGGSLYRWNSPQILGMFLFSALMLVLFLLIERRAKDPIISPGLIKKPMVAVPLMAIFLISFVSFCILIFLPLFFQVSQGLSATVSGNLLIPAMVSTAAGSLISGQLLSRGRAQIRTLGLISAVFITIGMFLLSRITVTTSDLIIILYLIVIAAGLGISTPIYAVAIQNAVDKSAMGIATTMSVFVQTIGSSVGLAVYGVLLNNRFATEFLTKVPDNIRSLVPAETLSELAANPRVLINPEAYSQLQTTMNQIGPQGANILEVLMNGMREALASAITEIFFISIFLLIAAIIVNFFLKKVHLSKHH